MSKLFDNFEVKAVDKIHGSTMIDHKIRCDMELTMEEYCIMELLYRRNKEDKPFDYDTILRYTGINIEWAEKIVAGLNIRKFIILPKDSKKLRTCQQWSSMHNKQTHTEFDTFWRKSGRIMWTGSKAASLRIYLKLRLKYTAMQLLKAKKDYFEFLNLKENQYRQVMACNRFLNQSDENFNQPWTQFTKDIIAKRDGSDITPVDGQKTVFSTRTRQQHDSIY